MQWRNSLQGRLYADDVVRWVEVMRKKRPDAMLNELFGLLHDADKRIAQNAALILSHAPTNCRSFLCERQGELIDLVMAAPSHTQQRLLLTVLRNQPFEKDDLRSDFLDYCLTSIGNTQRPVAVRALCIYLSLKQCRHFPELMDELYATMEFLEGEELTSGLLCAKRKAKQVIDKQSKQ